MRFEALRSFEHPGCNCKYFFTLFSSSSSGSDEKGFIGVSRFPGRSSLCTIFPTLAIKVSGRRKVAVFREVAITRAQEIFSTMQSELQLGKACLKEENEGKSLFVIEFSEKYKLVNIW
jgi:hypothetical protein